jgi:hypothetical protein
MSMPIFIDQHAMGSLTPEMLKEIQKQPRDELGVLHKELLYNKEENKLFCILDAPNKDAVLKHHQKAGIEPDYIIEVKSSNS